MIDQIYIKNIIACINEKYHIQKSQAEKMVYDFFFTAIIKDNKDVMRNDIEAVADRIYEKYILKG